TRSITVRQQHRLALLQQLLGPIAISRLDRFGMAGQSTTSMERDHDWKRAIAIRLVKLRVQYAAAGGDVDLMRNGQRRRIRGKGRGKESQKDNGCRIAHAFAGLVMGP